MKLQPIPSASNPNINTSNLGSSPLSTNDTNNHGDTDLTLDPQMTNYASYNYQYDVDQGVNTLKSMENERQAKDTDGTGMNANNCE